MEKIIRYVFFLVSLILTTLLLLSIDNIGNETKSYSLLVLLSFVGMLVMIGTYTYTRIFDDGAVTVSSYVLWGLVVGAAAVIAFVYICNLASSTNSDLFNRLAPIPASLSFFYAIAAVTSLGGDKYLGPLRSIIRLGKNPENSNER